MNAAPRRPLLAVALLGLAAAAMAAYPVVDTGQGQCYDAAWPIAAPAPGEPFHGQDAQHDGNACAYQDNGDGTVTDLVTGLMWQQDPGDKMTLEEAELAAAASELAGHTDWRLPTIEELYSLIQFSGTDPSGLQGDDTSGLVPFIDPVFAFRYGDPDAGERVIDAQYCSSTRYVSTTMNGDETVFGVNFADGRIKGYPVIDPMTGSGKLFFVLLVRGGEGYGVNQFEDLGDGTVVDHATGLMWMQQDSGHLGAGGMIWEDALAWAENLELAGHDDWRLPDAKELQSIVDYTRSPATHGTAAIDPVFSCSAIVDEGGGSDFPFYWTGTTHANHLGGGTYAVYVAFGTGYGFMEMPPGSGNYHLLDVHGAGCQRSDPKTGDPADYPHGHGPQGDVIRIFNHVRCVRDADVDVSVDETPRPETADLAAAPNPFNPGTALSFEVTVAGEVELAVLDLRGRRLATLARGYREAGRQTVRWDGRDDAGRALPSGVYLAALRAGGARVTTKLVLAR